MGKRATFGGLHQTTEADKLVTRLGVKIFFFFFYLKVWK